MISFLLNTSLINVLYVLSYLKNDKIEDKSIEIFRRNFTIMETYTVSIIYCPNYLDNSILKIKHVKIGNMSHKVVRKDDNFEAHQNVD